MAVRERTGSELITAYRGLGSAQPLLAITLAIFLFSLTGIPPFAGFIGKFYLFAAVCRRAAVLLRRGGDRRAQLRRLALLLRADRTDGFLEKAGEGEGAVALTRAVAGLLTVLAVPTLVLGIWWGPLAGLIERSAGMMR